MIFSRKQILLIVLIPTISFCLTSPASAQNVHNIQVFEQMNIQFNPGSIPDGLNEKEKRRYLLERIEAFYRKMDADDRERYPR